jgi:hypothetical protein
LFCFCLSHLLLKLHIFCTLSSFQKSVYLMRTRRKNNHTSWFNLWYHLDIILCVTKYVLRYHLRHNISWELCIKYFSFKKCNELKDRRVTYISSIFLLFVSLYPTKQIDSFHLWDYTFSATSNANIIRRELEKMCPGLGTKAKRIDPGW